MSEELESKYLKNGKIEGQFIGDFEYFQIGSTTFKQLTTDGIIPNTYNKSFTSHKPDRLIIDRSSSKPNVIAVIEDKKSGKFTNESEKLKAIQQCNNYCQELKAGIGIITDGKSTIWINPKQKNKDNEYLDKVVNKKRSYFIIKKEDGFEIVRKFEIKEKEDVVEIEKMSDETRKIYKLIKEITEKINSKNSIIKEPETIDPLPLARKVWQAIWVATGKSPEKCLYNVVELFIFKFLSDLEVLDENFEELYKRIVRKDSAIRVLQYYVKNCRDEIHNKFKKGSDNTSIINGTIFVDEFGNANTSQANLFVESIVQFKEFEKEYDKFSVNNIDKDFKTKLYESFLKQTEGLKTLGQFFTPRKVIRNIVEMTGIVDFNGGERVCDPFCGVGGFVLEPLNLEERSNDFRPKNGIIKPKITYRGYDKGFEKDEERTIILAKANMLIHLAELLAESKNTSEFTNAFNKTFKLIRTNLGAFGEIDDSFKEETKFDLIVTNPPYLKSGSRTLKNEINQNSNLKNFYSVNGGGLEGLAIEWIVRHLKKGGKAFIVVPDGILNRDEDKKLRGFILKECYLDAIISLPLRTFYTTSKKTYILVITKKDDIEIQQEFPVFTYLVSEIGESRDVYRFEIEQNDLENAKDSFNAFKNSKEFFVKNNTDQRCKLQPINKFQTEKHWIVDKWWSDEEKIKLGILEKKETINLVEFASIVENLAVSIEKHAKEIKEIIQEHQKEIQDLEVEIASDYEVKNVKISHIFEVKKGDSKYTKAYIDKNKGGYPVYSSQTVNLGEIGGINTYDYDEECLTWTTDGTYVGTVFYRNNKFSITTHAGLLKIKNEFINDLSYSFLKFALNKILPKYKIGEGSNKRLGTGAIKNIQIQIPITQNGKFNLKAQQEIAQKYQKVEEMKSELKNQVDIILKTEIEI